MSPNRPRAGGIQEAPGAAEMENQSSLFLTPLARKLRALSVAQWGDKKALEIVGTSPALLELQSKLQKVARYREPVLLSGESGVGKEQLAEAIYLLGESDGRPYVSVNCPQYQDGNLTVSELFGHAKGSFTGAVTDHRGAFEEADGGVIFLDEIGDLPANAQAMLLRALASGEYRPLGASKPRSADVRVISATNRPLNQLVMSNHFRYDLFSRLTRFHLNVPPLRERGDDWLLLAEHALDRLHSRYGARKRLSAASLGKLQGYGWPGNVRQLISVVTTGYAMADGDIIEPDDFVALIDRDATENVGGATQSAPDRIYDRVVQGGVDFWTAVYQPFLDRDLNRAEVRHLIHKGLANSSHNYKDLLELFHLPASDYQRLMDFLRHHALKP